MKYFYVFKIYFSIAYKVYWLNNKYTKELIKELCLVEGLNEKSFSKDLLKRIKSYTGQCYVAATWACALRGKKLSREERIRVTYLGALTPILDDLTDDLKLKSSEILDYLDKKKEEEKIEFLIAKYLYTKLKSIRTEGFETQFRKALLSQDDSIPQLEEKKLTENELREITRNKGAMWILLYRSILSNPLKPGENEALGTLGYITQLINDAFDVYKDHKCGLQTLYTNSTDLNENYKEYIRVTNKMVKQYMNLDYEQKDIKKSLIQISTIMSRGVICTNQLLLLRQHNKGKFRIEEFTRKELICDMEKSSNIIKSFRYSTALYDQIKQIARNNQD